MNLLVLSNNIKRASFRQRIGIYLNTLQQNGINCEVAQLPAGTLARRRLFKRAAEFDGVFLHKKRLNFLDALSLRHYARRIIYDFDDAVMYSEKNPERPSRKRLKSFQRTVKLADLVIAGNFYLAEHAKKFNPRVEVLPTGLDAEAYRVENKPMGDGKVRLVWIGSKSTLRYLMEIKPALEEIGSHCSNVVLRIISDEFFSLKNISVEKHQWSEKTQVTDLAESDIGLAPLPDNRFTRGKCGFKVLQYAAAGLPVVASPVGVNADYVHDGITGFLATSISQWSDRIVKLITDSNLREKMGQASQNMVRSFDVNVVEKRLVNPIVTALKQ
jgi:glycosyltransferase involved in cell wall biosynthesis